MKLSVIIVTHNRKMLLLRCLSSIRDNTIHPNEIIIVDDGDPHATVKSLSRVFAKQSRINIRYCRVFPHKGPSYSRNLGIKKSKGDIIAFIDDDCITEPGWVAAIKKSHRVYPHLAITGYVTPVYPHNYWNQVLFLFHRDTEKVIHETNTLFGCNYSVKRSVFTRHHLFFNERMIHCSEELYLSDRLRKLGKRFLYDPAIHARHEFRTRARDIFKQWFRYGISDFTMWRVVPDYAGSADAAYFRTGIWWKKLLISPYRFCTRLLEIMKYLRLTIKDIRLMVGVAYIYAAYYLGVYREFLAWNGWTRIRQTTSVEHL